MKTKTKGNRSVITDNRKVEHIVINDDCVKLLSALSKIHNHRPIKRSQYLRLGTEIGIGDISSPHMVDRAFYRSWCAGMVEWTVDDDGVHYGHISDRGIEFLRLVRTGRIGEIAPAEFFAGAGDVERTRYTFSLRIDN